MSILSFNSYIEIRAIDHTQTRVTELRQPTVITSLNFNNGINMTLAGLRGYMILGNAPEKGELFKNVRKNGWQIIDTSIAELDQFAKSWTDPANIERLEALKPILEEFRIAQQEIEDIAHQPSNIESLNILLTKAAPEAKSVISAISNMLNIEAELPATSDRKRLLNLLADSRGSFALGLASIRAYLLSGNTSFKNEFEKHWQTNQQRFDQLKQNSELFSTQQLPFWEQYQQARATFSGLPNTMFASRSSKEWNKANYWLGVKAAPKAKQIEEILAKMSPERRKNIRKATKDGIIVTKLTNFENSRKLIEDTFINQNLTYDKQVLTNLFENFAAEKNTVSYLATKDDKPIATVFCVKDEVTSYYILGGYDSENRHEGAGALAMWNSIKKAKERSIEIFDFEGSMIPQIEKYVRGFGGKIVPFYRVNKSSYLVEVLLKTKEKTRF